MALKFASVVALADAGSVTLQWDDCGDADTHTVITDISPVELALPGSTTITGSGIVDQDTNAGQFKFDAKLAGVSVLKDGGSLCEDKNIVMPLNSGTIKFHGINCPVSAGELSVTLDINLLDPSAISNDLLTIDLSALSDTGDKLLCAALSVETPNLGFRPAPSGLIVDLSPEELATQLALNKQYEEESKTSNYVGPLNITSRVGFSSCNQVCSNWCWAAGATMAASAFPGTFVSCASDEEAVAAYIYGSPCSTSCPDHCNKGGTVTQIAEGIRYLSGADYTQGGVLMQSALDQALQHGPVVAAVNWQNGYSGGHAITVHGKSGGNYMIHDPEGEDHTVPFSGVSTYIPDYAAGRYYGSWVGTAYSLSASASVSV